MDIRSPAVESRHWLRDNPNASAFATNRFGDTENALAFVLSLCARGATPVCGGDRRGRPPARDWQSGQARAKIRQGSMNRKSLTKNARRGESLGDDHPVQNDWNGSAEVALISIARSHPCRRVAEATGDRDAAHVADELAQLRQAVEEAFPKARQFVRPGFDDGGRRRRRWL